MKADTFHPSTFADISQFPLSGLPPSIFLPARGQQQPTQDGDEVGRDRTGQPLHAESGGTETYCTGGTQTHRAGGRVHHQHSLCGQQSNG